MFVLKIYFVITIYLKIQFPFFSIKTCRTDNRKYIFLSSTNITIFVINDTIFIRNLRIAKLLLEKGGNPNLRIPNHDMESANESPLELLLCYYLRLIDVFGLHGKGAVSTQSSAEEIELINIVGINGELKGLPPLIITAQTR